MLDKRVSIHFSSFQKFNKAECGVNWLNENALAEQFDSIPTC